MSVSGTDNRVQSTGDGTTREFAFTFRIFAKGDLVVYNGTDLQVLDSDYEVKSDTFLADGVSYDFSAGGYVYFAEASTPATGDIITTVRTLTATQGVDLTVGGPLPVESVERMSDRLTMLVQQLIESIARAMILPVTTDYSGISLELPTPTVLNYLRWNATATALENASTVVESADADSVTIETIGTPTYATVQDYIDVIQSSGYVSGGTITDDEDGTITVAAGQGFIKITDSEIGAVKSFAWSETAITPVTGSTNYIYVDYGTGTPTVKSTTTRSSIKTTNQFTLGRVYRDGTTLYIIQSGIQLANIPREEYERLLAVRGVERASGATVGAKVDGGDTRYLTCTAGVFYLGRNRMTTTAQDTTDGDTFTEWYDRAGWESATGKTVINNTQYETGTGLATLTNTTKYGVRWIYIVSDGSLHCVFGTSNDKLSDAEEEKPPSSLPGLVSNFGILAAKIIILKSATTMTVQSAFGCVFQSGNVSDHNDLAGIQGGTTDEYYHTTSDENAAITGAASPSSENVFATMDDVGDSGDVNSLSNVSISATIADLALTVALKGADGNDPSSSNVVSINFRSATLTDGKPVSVEVTSALSLVLSQGSKLGFMTGEIGRMYVWALNNDGTVELAVSRTADIFPESNLVTTVAEGGAGGADSATVMYSTTARTNVACRCIGYIEIQSGETPGNWSHQPTVVQVMGAGVHRTGDIVQRKEYLETGTATFSTAIPWDDTIPQITEGNQAFTLAITPTSALNKLVIDSVAFFGSSNNVYGIMALFQDTTASALAAGYGYVNNYNSHMHVKHEMLAGTTTETTFKVRIGPYTLDYYLYLNGGSDSLRKFGGVLTSGITIMEVFA